MNKLKKFAMKFSCLILRKIAKIVVTRGQILMQKNAPHVILGGALPQTPLGELTELLPIP